MAKNLEELITGRHIPKAVLEAMEQTEPGMLAAALDAMVYARSHDEKMRSTYPEKVYLGVARSAYMAQQIGMDPDDSYAKSDVVVGKVISLLNALALQYALERR